MCISGMYVWRSQGENNFQTLMTVIAIKGFFEIPILTDHEGYCTSLVLEYSTGSLIGNCTSTRQLCTCFSKHLYQ
jgi:hypothetical protein